ncbi:uncharacterized protein DS421_7g213130 [Arachis hypogaea]|nr:uncharacterized protein DS421_7g213130 [Arachis hypogaea]
MHGTACGRWQLGWHQDLVPSQATIPGVVAKHANAFLSWQRARCSFLAPDIASHVAIEHAYRSWRWQRGWHPSWRCCQTRPWFLAQQRARAPLWCQNCLLRCQGTRLHNLALATCISFSWAKFACVALPRDTPMVPGVGNALELLFKAPFVAWRCLE